MNKCTTLILLIIGSVCCQGTGKSNVGSNSVSVRRNRFSAGKAHATSFNCPEDFGYYPHPDDCTKYFVCVFGGALLEACNGGLMYSNELQTCDWPRNVNCHLSTQGVSTVKITDPRTSNHAVLSATERLTPAASSISRGVDNDIRSSRQRTNQFSPAARNEFGESTKVRQARLITEDRPHRQRISTGFQAQETASHSFNVVASSPRPKISFPPILPQHPGTNHFTLGSSKAKPVKSSSQQDLFSDLLNLNDTAADDYFYYYDDLLYDDYFEPSTTTTTTRRPQTRRPSSSGSRVSNTKTSGPPNTIGSSPSRSRLVGSFKKPSPVSKGVLISDVWQFPPRRPQPRFPQPQVDTLATPCDPSVCRLPDCSCGGKAIPGGISAPNVPQMVLLTFDDSINDLNKKLYVELFERGRVNPNGCPITSTMYISHEWTDYSQVQNLYSDGHEIASHSITHSFGEKFATSKWAREISGQREIMSAYGGVRMEDIRGMRAPFLAIGGNNMFRMLYDQNFTYDSSMPVYENNPPSWPYTLDYKIFHSCMIPPCPTNSYPGVWQVPMVMWQDLNGGRCSMGDACTTPPTAEGVYKMLIKNFERHYTTNRSPFGLFYHAAWFTTAHHKEGFIAFLDTIAAMDDVWIVTNWQALQWVRDPVPLSQVKQFPPFKCDYPERPARCSSPKVCNVWHKGSVRYLKTCQRCPDTYPWVGHTGVKSDLNF